MLYGDIFCESCVDRSQYVSPQRLHLFGQIRCPLVVLLGDGLLLNSLSLLHLPPFAYFVVFQLSHLPNGLGDKSLCQLCLFGQSEVVLLNSPFLLPPLSPHLYTSFLVLVHSPVQIFQLPRVLFIFVFTSWHFGLRPSLLLIIGIFFRVGYSASKNFHFNQSDLG